MPSMCEGFLPFGFAALHILILASAKAFLRLGVPEGIGWRAHVRSPCHLFLTI